MRLRFPQYLLLLFVLWTAMVCGYFGLVRAQALLAADPDAAQVPNPPPNRTSAPVRELSRAALLAELRKGGYVWYFRHAATDFSQNDKASRSFEDCANQRNLIERGRAEARSIGEEIAKLQIPVGRVLASPLCRTMETARLIFGRAEASLDVRAQRVIKPGDDRFAPLHKLLIQPQPKGTHLVIISHGNPFYGVAGPPYLAEGEVAIVRGLGKDFEVIGRIRPEEWKTLGP